MATELKVCDLELECYADMVEQWDNIDSVMSDCLLVLENIRDKAIKSGDVHDSIERLCYYVEDIYGNMKGTGKQAASQVSKFLKKIEETDLELYKGV